MSGIVSRSISMISNGDSMAKNGGGDTSESPLKIFVLAKKEINKIFSNVHDYVYESEIFILSESNDIIKEEHINLIQNFAEKVNGIRDVLSRDHMKVAFFGRTSNGKSTVINSLLQNRILPTGLGHTTNCFLQVEGSDNDEAYLIVEGESKEKRNVESVLQLANALCTEKLDDSALVKIFWPKQKCSLLKDDVVLVDSPGIDVSANLDKWIDNHCMDADVFVLVSNAESTLMRTEKNFFHHVSEKLSKPNIFILNNRWDASDNESENLELVRKQHMDRAIDFLANELGVVTRKEAEDRIFFVSAKEVLQSRQQVQKGLPFNSGNFAEGFQKRYYEFVNFERKFEECLSKTAVKTKFDQHSKGGRGIILELAQTLDNIHQTSLEAKQAKLGKRKELWDKLEFLQQQMLLLTGEVKHQICHMVEQVEMKVSAALTEEIRRLSLLVNDFEKPFSSDQLVLSVYKKELHTHLERGLGSNLRARLNTALQCNIESAQKEMIDRVTTFFPPEEHHRQLVYSITPRQNFEILYRINCESLCSDFQEDLEFKFTFGLLQMIKRFTGKKGWKKNESQDFGLTKSLPPTAPQTPSNNEKTVDVVSTNDFLAVVDRLSLISPQSQTTVGVLAISGFLVRSIGWRVIAITFGVYGVLYLYERLTWTNKAKEKSFKQQYVNHTTRKLKLIVDLTSANCSHQVQQ